jgi:malate dehydrogenase (oxaloacetate-decarboxylating)
MQAHKEGLTQGMDTDEIEPRIRARIWMPHYLPFKKVPASASKAVAA